MHFKAEFRRRLSKVVSVGSDLLEKDSTFPGFTTTYDLFPYIFQLYSYLYNSSKAIKH